MRLLLLLFDVLVIEKRWLMPFLLMKIIIKRCGSSILSFGSVAHWTSGLFLSLSLFLTFSVSRIRFIWIPLGCLLLCFLFSSIQYAVFSRVFNDEDKIWANKKSNEKKQRIYNDVGNWQSSQRASAEHATYEHPANPNKYKHKHTLAKTNIHTYKFQLHKYSKPKYKTKTTFIPIGAAIFFFHSIIDFISCAFCYPTWK